MKPHLQQRMISLHKLGVFTFIFSFYLLIGNLMAQEITHNIHEEKAQRLHQELQRTVDNKKVFGSSFAIKQGENEWLGASGDISTNGLYFIASTTKLFTTAIIMKLREQGQLQLNDAMSKYVDEAFWKRLHVYKGIDYSAHITIQQLLAHTSGLPDYFQGKGPNGKSLEDELVAGADQFWTFEDAMNRTKAMKPLFAPGNNGKAHYSDANFQLLGKIIERITGKTYIENCEEFIVKPLQLKHTYVYADYRDTLPKTLYYKNQALPIPKGMTSFGPDGGVVSTSAEMLIFLQGFFQGKLFPKEYLAEMQEWNAIFFPMKSGVGLHLFKLPWIFNPAGKIPYFIGHSGLSGALAYYSPQKDLYIAGTVNQVAYPDVSFKTMIKLAQIWLKE